MARGMRDFQVDVQPDRDRVIVSPVGEIDLSTAPVVLRQVTELVDSGFTQVVLDLRQVGFVDSQGIQALMSADQHATEHGASLTVVVSDKVTRRALEICGLMERLDIRTSP